ncbi:hypothetical protein BJ508DRAFT_335955 [Ascobolus immersus RN42]|uniref:Uncharacterized protein n=1 Tax=Ascobolus immersus RN42 TaxID=1160509 RepID=A0A3N4HGL2_ASCIM|nr:hypothetical protein BJ508DRAFT_335955 [Ascobolus immersus RN42]
MAPSSSKIIKSRTKKRKEPFSQQVVAHQHDLHHQTKLCLQVERHLFERKPLASGNAKKPKKNGERNVDMNEEKMDTSRKVEAKKKTQGSAVDKGHPDKDGSEKKKNKKTENSLIPSKCDATVPNPQ